MRCLCLALLLLLPNLALATPLVSGNGHGFIILDENTATLTKFYAHPHRFEKPDPNDQYGEGIETANFITSLRWADGSNGEAEYLNQSQIMEVKTDDSIQNFYLPFGLELNTAIVSWRSTDSTRSAPPLDIQWANRVRSDETLQLGGHAVRVLTFQNVNEGLLLYPLDNSKSSWILVSVEKTSGLGKIVRQINEWQNGLGTEALISRELARVEKWRVKPNIHFQSENERKLWRQSEMVLRMAQNREINRPGRYAHGLILASLPEGIWFVSWVRDMAYAVIALIRMGHQEEARMAIEAYFQARPMGRVQSDVRGYPYQISVVRYFGDGSEEPYFTMGGWPNIEFDNWGLVLWTLGEYVEKFQDRSILDVKTHRGSLYDSAKNFVVTPLLGNLDSFENGLIVSMDTSIWEEPQSEAKHFAYSTMAAIHGLGKFLPLAQDRGDHRTASILNANIPLLQKGFHSAFGSQGWLRGTAEESYKNEIDAAVLESIYLRVVQDPGLVEKTLERLEHLRMPSGGYRRVRGETEYEKHEFLFVNFSLADILLQRGDFNRVRSLVKPMVDKSVRDHGFVPEMYISAVNDQFPGEVGDPTGSIPMVGYGAGIYIRHLLEREKKLYPDMN